MRAGSAAAFALALALVVACKSSPPGPLGIENARGRILPNGAGAAYFDVRPNGAEDRLLSASSALADSVELHDLREDGDVIRMIAAPDGFKVDPKDGLTLAPGGKHLMFFGARVDGGELPLTLRFERAGAHTVTVRLAMPPGEH